MKKKFQPVLSFLLFLILLLITSGCVLELKYQFHPGHQEDTELSLRPTLSAAKLDGGKVYSQEEILSNMQQTNNIVLVGILVVLIIFIGTFLVIWRKRPVTKNNH